MRPHRVFWGSAALGFFLLWAVANYPALVQEWWYRDDFTYGWFFAKCPLPVASSCLYESFEGDGRPFAFLAEWPFWFNYYPHTGINIALHWAQGLAHIGLALLIASTLSRHLPRWQAALSVVPFLVWGFNGEAILYSSASHYLLSALFSLLGLRLILAGVEHANQWWGALGALLTALSLLTLQTAGTVGILVWSILLALRLIDSGRLQKACLWEGLWLFGGYSVGGLLTTWLANLNNSPRAQMAPDFFEKFNYWLALNHTFLFWPDYYPLELKILHGALLALGLAIPAYFLLKAGRPRTLGFILLVFVTGFILPYFANLVVASDSMSFRTFYFAPLTFTLILAVLFNLGRQSRWIAGALAAVVAMIGIFDIGIAQANARDYVRLYQADREVVLQLEKVAAATQCYLVTTPSEAGSENLFGMQYPWLDAHTCDFQFNYSRGYCIELLSPLRVVRPTDQKTALLLKNSIQNLPTTPGVRIYFLSSLHVIYLQLN